MTPELCTQILTIPSIADVLDTKLPDANSDSAKTLVAALAAGKAVVVYYPVSDVPTMAIDAAISCREQRITLDVQAQSITTARATKEALITALNGWHGGPIASCLFESAPAELYDSDLVPPRYCIPVDFTISF